MDNNKHERAFEYEFRKRLIMNSIKHMNERQARYAAYYYFDENRLELAKRLAKRLAGSKELANDFYESVPIPFWKRFAPLEDMVDDTLYYQTEHGRRMIEQHWQSL